MPCKRPYWKKVYWSIGIVCAALFLVILLTPRFLLFSISFSAGEWIIGDKIYLYEVDLSHFRKFLIHLPSRLGLEANDVITYLRSNPKNRAGLVIASMANYCEKGACFDQLSSINQSYISSDFTPASSKSCLPKFLHCLLQGNNGLIELKKLLIVKYCGRKIAKGAVRSGSNYLKDYVAKGVPVDNVSCYQLVHIIGWSHLKDKELRLCRIVAMNHNMDILEAAFNGLRYGSGYALGERRCTQDWFNRGYPAFIETIEDNLKAAKAGGITEQKMKLQVLLGIAKKVEKEIATPSATAKP